MNTAPQQVTERYITNLISYGVNKEFSIERVLRNPNRVGEEFVGHYYWVCIGTTLTDLNKEANGATISQAVRRALEKHGVTFR